MLTCAVIAEKGGVGKTTVALAIAVAAVRKGETVAVLDLDPQATASRWTDRREAAQPWVTPVPAARLRAAIDQAKAQGVTFLVIDVAPHAGADAAEAARAADVVLVVSEPHLFALETLEKMRDLLKIAGGPVAAVVLNKVGIQGKEGEQAAEFVTSLGFVPCPVFLHQRAAHRHAGNLGQTAQEFEPDGKAASEIEHLYMYTLSLVHKR